jgi:transposase InsO family protein
MLSVFVSREFKQFCFGLGIKHVTTTPYYPQPSHAERFNRNLRSALIAYYSQSQTSWDEGLMFLQLVFNTAKHKSTRTTPFEVMFPFRAGSPLLHDWGIQELLPDNCTKASILKRWADVRKSLFQSHQRIAQNYNKGRIPQPFKVGDMVFIKNHPLSDASRNIAGKLSPRWRGPFSLQSFLTPVTARLVNSTTGEYVARAHL